MYLPAGKYKVLYSQGEIKNSDGTPYAGPYIKTYDSRYFQGTSIERPGPALVGPPLQPAPSTPPPPAVRGPGGLFVPEGRKKKLQVVTPTPRTISPSVQGPGGLYVPEGRIPPADRGKTTADLFYTMYLPPSEADYQNTQFTRYIIQRRGTRQIIETTQARYNRLLAAGGFAGVQLTWKIIGPLNDVTYDKGLIRGTTVQNIEAMVQAESTIPQIQQFLTDPGQYTRTPERVIAIEQATGNKVILRTEDFVLLRYRNLEPFSTTEIVIPTYVAPGYVITGYVL